MLLAKNAELIDILKIYPTFKIPEEQKKLIMNSKLQILVSFCKFCTFFYFLTTTKLLEKKSHVF